MAAVGLFITVRTKPEYMGLFDDEPNIAEGDRIIADFDPEVDRDRGVVSLRAQDEQTSYAPSVDVEETTTGTELGSLGEPPGSDVGVIERFGGGRSDGTTVAQVRDITVTDRTDLDPIGIGRDRNSGRFTPDNVEPAPSSPADRDPDDGEFVTPDPRPVTDIGRQRDDGLFDLF